AGDYSGPHTFHGAGISTGSGGTLLGTGSPGLTVASGGLTVVPASSFADESVLTGAGRIRGRIIYAADSNSNFDVTTADVLVIKSSLAAHIYTLLSTGASDGSTCEVENFSSNAQVIHNAGGATIATVPAFGGSGARPGVARFK